MAKFKLTAPAFFPGDKYLEAGTIVGDGTEHPVDGKSYHVTSDMEGLDDEGKKLVAAAIEKYTKVAPIETLPINDGGIAPVKVTK